MVELLEKYLSVRQVAARYSTSPASIWRWCRCGGIFPDPIKISPGCTRWALSALEAHEAKQRETAEAPPAIDPIAREAIRASLLATARSRGITLVEPPPTARDLQVTLPPDAPE